MCSQSFWEYRKQVTEMFKFLGSLKLYRDEGLKSVNWGNLPKTS